MNYTSIHTFILLSIDFLYKWLHFSYQCQRCILLVHNFVILPLKTEKYFTEQKQKIFEQKLS